MTILALEQLQNFLNQYPHEDIADVGGWEKLEASFFKGTVDDLKHAVPTTARLDRPLKRKIFNIDFDITRQALPRQYGTILCMDTFEHLFDPVRAAENIVKSLKEGGYLFLTTVFMFHYHRSPVDTYRYTDDSLKWLFRELEIDRCWFDEEHGHPDNPARMGREWRVSIIAHKNGELSQIFSPDVIQEKATKKSSSAPLT